MKIRELIEKLETMDPNMRVTIAGASYEDMTESNETVYPLVSVGTDDRDTQDIVCILWHSANPLPVDSEFPDYVDTGFCEFCGDECLEADLYDGTVYHLGKKPAPVKICQDCKLELSPQARHFKQPFVE